MSFITELIVLNSVHSSYYASYQLMFVSHMLDFLYYCKCYTYVWPWFHSWIHVCLYSSLGLIFASYICPIQIGGECGMAWMQSVAYRGGVWSVQTPHPQNSEVLTKLSRNSLKVPKIKKILLYEIKFLVPNYCCLQNPWLGGYCPQIPVLSVLCPQLNLLNPPPSPKNSWVCHWMQWAVPSQLPSLWRSPTVFIQPKFDNTFWFCNLFLIYIYSHLYQCLCISCSFFN
jgi:hypothetical protein